MTHPYRPRARRDDQVEISSQGTSVVSDLLRAVLFLALGYLLVRLLVSLDAKGPLELVQYL